MLFDFQCTNTECQHLFEELVSAGEAPPNCPKCQTACTQVVSLNTASQQSNSIKYWELRNKAVLMKKRMTGQLPWRKHSESQTD